MLGSDGPGPHKTRTTLVVLSLALIILLGFLVFCDAPQRERLQAERARAEEQARVIAACASTPTSRQHLRSEAMVAAADPRAVDAALEMLREGGTAADAAIAAETVLGLVEPQSSGVGGGGYMLFYDAQGRRVTSYDGRERAPAGATPNMFLDARGQPMDRADAVNSGRSIGTPLLVAMLRLAHDDHGRLPWARLFEPAIRLAEHGFIVTPRLAQMMHAERRRLSADDTTRAYFLDSNGNAWPAGHLLRNIAYAATLRAIAMQGPSALTQGPIAQSIVAAAQRGPRAGTLALEDLQSAAPRRLEPLCGTFRNYRVCTGAPPTAGNAVIATLGLFERARPQPGGARNPDDWAAFLWASRLAYADRDHYMADDGFVPVPARELTASNYLDARSRLIDLKRAPTRVDPGVPAGEQLYHHWANAPDHENGTAHVSVIDTWGNAVALTATVETLFGSKRMASGFVLNNQLTDFAFQPTQNGLPVANAVEPRKRPRSSMSPTIVTDRNGGLVLVTGSPGGSEIIARVARATIGILDWNLSVRDALAIGNVTANAAHLRVETSRMPSGVSNALRARGWNLREAASDDDGPNAIRVTTAGLDGGADPRGEGVVGCLRAPAD